MWLPRDKPGLTLLPEHAILFGKAVYPLSVHIGWEEDDARWDSQVPVFDALTQGQRQNALWTVSQALLFQQVPPPKPSAHLVAAIHVVYVSLALEIEVEIEARLEPERRGDALAALHELGEGSSGEECPCPASRFRAPAADSEDMRVWTWVLQTLEASVVAGYPVPGEPVWWDALLARRGSPRRRADLEPDYFTAVPAEPGPALRDAIRESQRDLLGLHLIESGGYHPPETVGVYEG